MAARRFERWPKRRGAFKGTRPGWKKAVVQLRAGDVIEIFQGAQL